MRLTKNPSGGSHGVGQVFGVGRLVRCQLVEIVGFEQGSNTIS